MLPLRSFPETLLSTREVRHLFLPAGTQTLDAIGFPVGAACAVPSRHGDAVEEVQRSAFALDKQRRATDRQSGLTLGPCGYAGG